ncbi:MAG: hypothetical protein JOY67_00135 [Hyphomicrobiales bacterium]|nr:hypothetical protein [Hyphomicrobiales bacterium]MBV9518407.1 hypothetical protein [Hyphomicrobiales bacterium]
MRRLLIEEPVSRAALASRQVGLFAWLSLALSLLLAWRGRLQPFEALAAVLACAALAVVAMLFATIAFTAGWRHGARGMRSAVIGLLLGIALLAYPAGVYLRDLVTPPALDLTTDPDNPPQPLQPLKQLAKGWGPPVEATTTDAGAPRAISALLLDEQMNDALGYALRAAGMSGWHVTTVDYARPPFNKEARFAAILPSLLIHWPSDAIVRLLATEDGIRVDVRLIARQPWPLLHGDDGDIAAYLDRVGALTQGKPGHTGR